MSPWGTRNAECCATSTSECRSQHPERAGLLIEELLKERSKAGHIRVPRRARDGKGGLAREIAPKQGGQIRNMIRMQMTDCNQREVLEPASSLRKTKERAASYVHENSTATVNPNQIAG